MGKSHMEEVQEWDVYVPLEVIDQLDINILMQTPPPKALPPATSMRRAWQTGLCVFRRNRYEIHKQYNSNESTALSHRCTILLSPSQTSDYVKHLPVMNLVMHWNLGA